MSASIANGSGRDEHQAHAAVVLHQVAERAHGAAALQVAHHADDLAVDAAARREAALQRVDVEQRLGRVLVLAAAGVDDRHGPRNAVHQLRRRARRNPAPGVRMTITST